MKTTRKQFVEGLVAIATAGSHAACAHVAAEPLLRLGIVSDLHHTTRDDGTRGQNCLCIEPALRYFDVRRADGIIVCGDLSDFGTVASLHELGAMWDRVFPCGRRSDGEPIAKLMHYGDHEMSTLMQNPKYRKWALEVSSDPDELNHFILDYGPGKAWEESFHEKWAPIQVKTVKGYTFVLAHHPVHTTESNNGNRIPGLAEFLKALKLDPNKPFFYSQHRHFEVGDTAEVLASYPNVIALHGHLHMNCVDELSLTQERFVKISVPSLNYCGTRYWRENSRQLFPEALLKAVDCSKSWQGLFASVYIDRIVVERRDFLNGLPLGYDWVIPLPTPNDGLIREVRAKRSVPPQFAPDARVTVSERIGNNRKHVPVEQVLLRFPVAHATGSALRAYDYEVTASAGGKALKTRAVFSQGCYWADEKDVLPVECPFAKSELPRDWRTTVSFTVKPRDAFGNCGKPIIFSARNMQG